GAWAGGGKTVLLRRFFDECRGGARLLWGACDALFTPRPLGPFLDIAESTGGELEERGEGHAGAFDGAAGRGRGGGGGLEELVEAHAGAFDVAAALMRELRTRSPTILVLEDVHWADDATLDVLRLVGRGGGAMP